MLSRPLRISLGIVYVCLTAAAVGLAAAGMGITNVSEAFRRTATLWIFLTHLAGTLFLCGLIWTVQIVNYPLMARVGRDAFPEYHRGHLWRMTAVVAVPMLVELLTALLLLVYRPPGMTVAMVWAGIGLLGVIWLSTALLQVPRHERLSCQYQSRHQSVLTVSNWVRTMAWSLRALLLLCVLRQMLVT